MKGVKNDTELSGMRNCHIRDGVAKTEFLAWLENRFEEGDDSLTEVSVAEKLEEFRRKQKDFISLSFDTISAVGGNGSIIHYHSKKQNCSSLNKQQIYLCDSGAQYKDGTTDVTRTHHFVFLTQK